MKNKDFNLIKYLASKNIFITEDNIKDKKFKMVNVHCSQFGIDAAKNHLDVRFKKPLIHNKNFKNTVASPDVRTKKNLKYSFNTIKNKSRNTNITLHGGQKIIFVDFKNKQINKKRGLKNV